MRTAIVIPSFRGAWRVARLLESIAHHDLQVLDAAHFLVVEDPSDEQSTKHYENTLKKFPNVDFIKLKNWSNMHGAAKHAFEYAAKSYDPDWFFYLGDDVLITPGAISSVLHFVERNALRTVGLVQIPYWNAHDLTPDGYDGNGNREWHPHGPGVKLSRGRPYLIETKDDMYVKDPSWLRDVPRNAHWDGDGFARSYVNVNGVGFLCRNEHYFSVGGFADGTWCLDESISVRTWKDSDYSIVCLPGPPFIHFFAGSTLCDPPAHSLHTHEAWERAMGMTKEEAGALSYARMHDRQPAVHREMTFASYWRPDGVSGNQVLERSL